jgi:hypothetical protein
MLQGRQLGLRRSNYRQGPDGPAKQAQGDGCQGYLPLSPNEAISEGAVGMIKEKITDRDFG